MRGLVVLVLAVALAACAARHAQADHVWRAWCGDPPSMRRAMFDTAAECHAAHVEMRATLLDTCRNSKTGPRYATTGKPLNGALNVVRYRNCAEFVADLSNCHCVPEAVE